MVLLINTRTKLIARSFIRVQSIDYLKLFFIILKLNFIKFLSALVTQYNLEIYQLDVKITFFYKYIDENIYMYILERLSTSSKSNLMYKVITF